MANPAYSAEKVEKAIDLPVVIKPAPKNTAPQPYRPVAGVTPELAQVVVYYPQGTVPATVYVDRELQSVLLRGQFTVLCAAPGAHTVESGSTTSRPIRANKTRSSSSIPKVLKPILFR